MTWFKVDDKLHSHSKTRKVLAEAPAALALWVVAGSWSSDNLTDGFVPDHQLPWLIPEGAEGMARQRAATTANRCAPPGPGPMLPDPRPMLPARRALFHTLCTAGAI